MLDFDGGFNLADVTGIANDARSKSLAKIRHDLDSIREFNDSVGRAYYHQAKITMFNVPCLTKEDSMKAEKAAQKIDFDSLYLAHKPEEKQDISRSALSSIGMNAAEITMKGDYSYAINRQERLHEIEAYGKITLSLLCIVFFFIGAPLGAIIRKGGLGVPVIISVLVFIVYYIFDFSGMRMARDDNWTVLFGKWISTAILTPLAVFFTYKANKDSVVFNMDVYKTFFRKMFGLRNKRHIFKKEVIINDPEYISDAQRLERITADIVDYSHRHSLLKAPNPIKVFFQEGDDRQIRDINEELETVIDDLSNTTDKAILTYLNRYPVIATHAHTRPFRRRWLNAVTGILLPVGLFFYLRMWRFRLRLLRDLRVIRATNEDICRRIGEMT